MKNLCLALLLLPIYVGGRAQLNLQPGATWLFRSQMWGTDYGEKWEYTGHSGAVVTMRVTVKCFASPGFYPCTDPVTITDRHFDITGDRVMLDGKYIADFSLSVGEEAPSPYDAQENPTAGSFCDSVRQHPATIIETGTETVNGYGYRYYKERFLAGVDFNAGTPVWDTLKFSERTWITAGYWWFADRWAYASECPVVDGYLHRTLVCYYDADSPAAGCDQEWFNKMAVEETDMSAGITVFPNPATEALQLTLPGQSGMWWYTVLSTDGKRVSGGSLPGSRVDVSALSPGMYFLVLENGGSHTRHTFVKQ